MSVIYVTSLLGSHGPWKDPGGYKIKPPQVRWDVSGLCAMLVSVLEVESKNIDFCTDALDVLLFVCEKKNHSKNILHYVCKNQSFQKL